MHRNMGFLTIINIFSLMKTVLIYIQPTWLVVWSKLLVFDRRTIEIIKVFWSNESITETCYLHQLNILRRGTQISKYNNIQRSYLILPYRQSISGCKWWLFIWTDSNVHDNCIFSSYEFIAINPVLGCTKCAGLFTLYVQYITASSHMRFIFLLVYIFVNFIYKWRLIRNLIQTVLFEKKICKYKNILSSCLPFALGMNDYSFSLVATSLSS